MTHVEDVGAPRSSAGRAAHAAGLPELSRLRSRLTSANVPPFEVELEDGRLDRFVGGAFDGDEDGPPRFRIRIRHERGLSALLAFDELRLGVAYLDCDLDVEGEFLECLGLRDVLTDRHPMLSLMRFLIPLVLGQRRSDL